jgi:hypothetical protein
MADCSALLNEGVALVRRASENDSAGNYEQALVFYQRALEHFISVLRLETNERIVNTLRPKVREYMARAEKLKQTIDASTRLLEDAPRIPASPPALAQQPLSRVPVAAEEQPPPVALVPSAPQPSPSVLLFAAGASKKVAPPAPLAAPSPRTTTSVAASPSVFPTPPS